MLHSPISTNSAKFAAISALAAAPPQKPFDITPILHPQSGIPSDRSRTFWSATANALYIVRKDGVDLFGSTPDFAAKLTHCPDLVDHGRRGPIGCDAEPLADLGLWHRADQAAIVDRPSAPVAYHAIGWLPTEMDRDGWREVVLQFLDEQILANGMVADWALHALEDGEGGWIKKPHMHAIITARFWKGPRAGQPQPAWLATTKRRKAVGEAWVTTVGVSL